MEISLFSNIDGISWSGNSLMVQNEEILQRVLEEAKRIGYTIKSLREGESENTIKEMEQGGTYLWYASLRAIRFGKCGSCMKYIPTTGIYSHGKCCEKCGEILYLEITDGTSLEFTFRDDGQGLMNKRLFMEAHEWDAENGNLYLYPKVDQNKEGMGRFSADGANAYLQENKNKWEYVWHHDQTLLKIPYHKSYWNEEPFKDTIDISTIYQHYYNISLVKLWDGKEYQEWDQLPIPESFIVYESWHNA